MSDFDHRVRLALTMATVVVGCLGNEAPVFSQAFPVITDADIERARRKQPSISDQDIERARQRHPAPSEVQLRAASNLASPNIDALPQPKTQTPIDLEALAKGYLAQQGAMEQPQGLKAGPGLFVFISLSMPQATLQRLVDQAARAKASVFIRGFVDGSLRSTVAQVQTLIGKHQVAIQIDPQAFDRFSIERVPSFVLVRDGTRPVSCASGTCAPPQAFLRSAGDVSLDYALEHMQRRAPQYTRDVGGFLRRLKG